MRLKVCAAFMLMPLFFNTAERFGESAIELTVLDVGQGLAVFVRTRDHTLLYDAGPGFLSGRSAGDLAVVPFLANKGVRRLHRLVISHPDGDHAGGVRAVLDALPVDVIRFGGEPEAGLFGAHPKAQRCVAGERWVWNGVEFAFLHPHAGENWTDNDGSCVLSIVGGGGRILLPGDIQREAEGRLFAPGAATRADVVVVPHHGSRSSSTEDFVRAVRARYAVVSAGSYNRWGFPNADVVRRWCASGADVVGTAEWGALVFRIDPVTGVATPRSYRAEHRRYWHDTPAAVGRSLCPDPV